VLKNLNFSTSDTPFNSFQVPPHIPYDIRSPREDSIRLVLHCRLKEMFYKCLCVNVWKRLPQTTSQHYKCNPLRLFQEPYFRNVASNIFRRFIWTYFSSCTQCLRSRPTKLNKNHDFMCYVVVVSSAPGKCSTVDWATHCTYSHPPRECQACRRNWCATQNIPHLEGNLWRWGRSQNVWECDRGMLWGAANKKLLTHQHLDDWERWLRICELGYHWCLICCNMWAWNLEEEVRSAVWGWSLELKSSLPWSWNATLADTGLGMWAWKHLNWIAVCWIVV
jgi:hypothetical protein